MFFFTRMGLFGVLGAFCLNKEHETGVLSSYPRLHQCRENSPNRDFPKKVLELVRYCTLTLHGTSRRVHNIPPDWIFVSGKPSLELWCSGTMLCNRWVRRSHPGLLELLGIARCDRDFWFGRPQSYPPQNSFEDDFPLEKVRHVSSLAGIQITKGRLWRAVLNLDRCTKPLLLKGLLKNIKMRIPHLKFKSHRYPRVAMFERKKMAIILYTNDVVNFTSVYLLKIPKIGKSPKGFHPSSAQFYCGRKPRRAIFCAWLVVLP